MSTKPIVITASLIIQADKSCLVPVRSLTKWGSEIPEDQWEYTTQNKAVSHYDDVVNPILKSLESQLKAMLSDSYYIDRASNNYGKEVTINIECQVQVS